MKQFSRIFQQGFKELALLTLLLVLIEIPRIANAQTVTGTVTDAADAFTLPGATITITDGSETMVGGVATDIDGRYLVSLSAPGTYSVTARFVGYQEQISSVTVSGSVTVTVDFALSQTGFELNTVVISFA